MGRVLKGLIIPRSKGAMLRMSVAFAEMTWANSSQILGRTQMWRHFQLTSLPFLSSSIGNMGAQEILLGSV